MSANPESILDSVKKALGLDSEATVFDLDIVLFINGAMGNLQQVGVGGDTGFVIQDRTTLWSQYVASQLYLNQVKQYIFTWVRLAFDPPGTSFGIAAFEKMAEELIWRIGVAVESENPPSNPFTSTARQMAEDTGSSFFEVRAVNLVFESVIVPDARTGNTFYLTLTGDCEIAAPINGTDGEHITLELTSNAHGVTWGNGWNFGEPGVPTLSTMATDVISAIYNEAAAQWYAGFTPGF